MKVLSTKILSADLKARLVDKGMHLQEHAFIEIQFLHNPKATEFIEANSQFPLVFTSRNGFLAYQSLNGNLNSKAYCMKGSTQQLIAEAGLSVIGVGSDSVELAEEILKQKPEAVVYLSGNLRSDSLPKALKNAGIVVHEFTVYKTTLTPVEIQDEFDAVLFFSPSAVRSFLSVNELPAHIPAYCIGKTTAAELKQHGHSVVCFPAEPDAEKMIDLLIAQNT